MKTKLLTICLLLVTSQVFASDDLTGKNIFCEEAYVYQTFSFIDDKRFQQVTYYLTNPEIWVRKGTYKSTSNVRYVRLSLDENFVTYKARNDWVKEKSKLSGELKSKDNFLDRQKVNIVIGKYDSAKIYIKCKLFNGTKKELDDSADKKFRKYFKDERIKKQLEEKLQRKKNKI